MSTTQIRPGVRKAIDAAIEQGGQPKVGRNGLGLILPTPSGRFRTLYNENGITPAGTYFYGKAGLPLPGEFDYTQDSKRKGRSQYIIL